MSTLPKSKYTLQDKSKGFDHLNISNFYKGYTPLQNNDQAPVIHFYKDNIFSLSHLTNDLLNKRQTVSLEEFFDYPPPLVLAFLPVENKKALQELESLHADITVMGGKLIVFTQTTFKAFKKTGYNTTNLTIYYDKDGYVASQFGIYNPNYPLWETISGIEGDNCSLSTFFVISPEDRSIVFRYIDYSFDIHNKGLSNNVFIREMLTSVYTTKRKQAYSKATTSKKNIGVAPSNLSSLNV